MKHSCIIVDDEKTARGILEKYIQDTPLLQLNGAFKNAIDALAYIQDHTVDFIFLDIEMPKLSGINFAKIIENKTRIIFTTAHREFAVDGFELNAVDYLLKPFSFDRFLKAVQRITAQPQTVNDKTDDFIYVKVNRQMVKIDFSDLLYIEGLSNYIKIYLVDDSYVAYEKLSTMSKRLPSDSFMRIHKSYIVNTKKIRTYTREQVEIEGKIIPVSSTYRISLLSFLEQ